MATSIHPLTRPGSVSPLVMEAMVFARVTTALERCADEGREDLASDPVGAVTRHVRLCEAVYQNARLWIALLDDLLGATNALPADLKCHLANLANACLRHGRRILADKADLQLLIDVNRSISIALRHAQLVATGAAHAPTASTSSGRAFALTLA